MKRYAVGVLARGWRRGATRWYVGTSVVLGLSITLLLVVSGLFAGMQAETQERVGDFYTSDARIQAQGTGVIPARTFFDLNGTLEKLERTGDASIRLESQGVLSRRGLFEAVATEDERFDVGPGEARGDEVVALGAVIGITHDGPDRKRIQQHLVTGRLPEQGDGSGSMELVMSLARFDQFLTPEERSELAWPPTADAISKFAFEITAAKVVRNEDDQLEDVIRRPAHIVGLYESGVDLLDGLTYVAAIEDVRQLNGHEPDAFVANVIVMQTDDTGQVHRLARQNGWISQGEAAFTDRYLGQLIDVLQGLSVLMTVFLFMLPAFLIIHGVGRQLETHNREIAVCHAIGVRRRTVRQALGWVVLQVAAVAVVGAAVLTTIIGLILHWTLPGLRSLPLPMDFEPTGLAIGLAFGVSMLSVAAALWIAFRSQAKQELASTLRTF